MVMKRMKIKIIAVLMTMIMIPSVVMFSGCVSDNSSSKGPIIGTAGSVAIPSDEDGGVVHGDGFTVETMGYSSYYNLPLYTGPKISEVEIVKIREGSGIFRFQVNMILVASQR